MEAEGRVFDVPSVMRYPDQGGVAEHEISRALDVQEEEFFL